MSLATIRQDVYDESDYDPERPEYKLWVDNKINDVYLQLAMDRVWPWACALDVPIHVAADVVAPTAVCTNGSVTVTDVSAPFTSDMEGRHFFIEDYGDHRIAKVNSASTIQLDTPFSGSTDTYIGAVQHRYITLPEDCERLLYAVNKMDNRVYYYESRNVTGLAYLDESVTSVPHNWTPAPDAFTQAPLKAPTLAQGLSVGTVEPGTYEVCYTFTYMGVESGPSPVASIDVLAGPNASMRVTLPVTVFNSGWYRNIYIRRVDAGGRLYAFRQTTGLMIETATTVNFTAPIGTTWYGNAGIRLLEGQGRRQQFQLRERQSESETLHITYHRRAPRLIEDADSPLLPTPYHEYIVQATLMRVAKRHGKSTLLKHAQDAAKAQQQRIEAKYLTPAEQRVVRGNAWGRHRSLNAARTFTEIIRLP